MTFNTPIKDAFPFIKQMICNIMNYVSGRFRRETGENLTDFIQKERMAAAIRYFNTTNMSVAEVAGNVGISDFAYFFRIFKKHIGSSPNAYKKMVNP